MAAMEVRGGLEQVCSDTYGLQDTCEDNGPSSGDDCADDAASLVEKMLTEFSTVRCPSFKHFAKVLTDSGVCPSAIGDELQCRRVYCEFMGAKLEQELKKKDIKLEQQDLQLEQQGHQLQHQEDKLLQLMMIM